MHLTSLVRAAVLSLGAVSLTGCLPYLLLCEGIERGPGATAAGSLAAGEHASHTLDLTPDAQNDVYVTPRDPAQAGITYDIYVTSAECMRYWPLAPMWELRYPVIPQDPCAVIDRDYLKQRPLALGSARFEADARVMVRQHEVSGANQFKLWIIGNSRMPIAYDIAVWWATGSDC